ncbi:Protein C01F1.3 a [Aphelenchoides avenae]|nr:Protein C01F1.3 a [Aphelenchus avenae]
MSHQPKNVLVTGGCGFIGSNFINFNPWPEANIVNVDKLILNSDINYVDEAIRDSPCYKLVLGDVGNSALIERVLEENNIDTVVHFAADCTSTRCYADPCEALQNNLISFIEFLEVTRQYGKVKKFVHISTDEVSILYQRRGIELPAQYQRP